MKKIAVFLLAYLLIGVAVTQHRMHVEHWSRGGPEIAVVVLIYPVIYPYGETIRFVRAIEEYAYRRESNARHVALLSPPGYEPLVREGILAYERNKPIAPYDFLVQKMKKNPPSITDARTAYLLHQLSLATQAMGDGARARADASDFAGKGDAASNRIAAAILRGAYETSPDAPLARDAMSLYERVYIDATPKEAPFAAYALGTAYEACGIKDEALARYREAIDAGWIDLGMRASIRAIGLADDDKTRLEFVKAFTGSLENPGGNAEDELKRRLTETEWGDYRELTWYRRQYEASLILGHALLPLGSASQEGAARFDAFFDADQRMDNLVGRNYGWWEELISCAVDAFDSFPAKLAAVEHMLDTVLKFEEDYIHIDTLLHQRTREVYYRLYDETGDRRWLECALPSQLKLRPKLEKFEGYIRSEIAFMEGEYRKHFDLVERRFIEHDDYPSIPRHDNFLGKKMAALEIRVGEKTVGYAYALERYQSELFDALHEMGAGRGKPTKEKLHLYEAGKLPPPFGDFSDTDVHAKPQ